MGFGHRVYPAEAPPGRPLRRTARELSAPRLQVAEALEKAALAELEARKPDRVLATNVEFWSAVVLDFAEVPPDLFTPLFPRAPPDREVRRPASAPAFGPDRLSDSRRGQPRRQSEPYPRGKPHEPRTPA